MSIIRPPGCFYNKNQQRDEIINAILNGLEWQTGLFQVRERGMEKYQIINLLKENICRKKHFPSWFQRLFRSERVKTFHKNLLWFPIRGNKNFFPPEVISQRSQIDINKIIIIKLILMLQHFSTITLFGMTRFKKHSSSTTKWIKNYDSRLQYSIGRNMLNEEPLKGSNIIVSVIKFYGYLKV